MDTLAMVVQQEWRSNYLAIAPNLGRQVTYQSSSRRGSSHIIETGRVTGLYYHHYELVYSVLFPCGYIDILPVTHFGLHFPEPDQLNTVLIALLIGQPIYHPQFGHGTIYGLRTSDTVAYEFYLAFSLTSLWLPVRSPDYRFLMV